MIIISTAAATESTILTRRYYDNVTCVAREKTATRLADK